MNSVYEISQGPGRGPKDRERREHDRDLLIGTARSLIQEKGLRHVSGREITQRAGFSPGFTNRLFGSLDGLIVAANLPTLAALKEDLARADRPQASVAERLLALTDAYIAFAEREGQLWCALFEHQVEAAPEGVAQEMTALFALLERVLADAGVPADAAPLIARAFWSGVHGIVYLGRTGGLGPIGPDSVRDMAHLLVRTLARGLLSSP
ncbi:TetR/AcrR family transcriptional regulator [Microvirga arabica]|uniref:TetR/AcrR family transcriptional regulator n=1 Tax=Microvirga arabica TaxID=1128671 RepID=UPI0019398795|nr:TetR/AcrR family transcriptional regulator [Microvirga arabica]MBM1172043.1 TetR/AcrR family transcriptional regulator [Microvirga arabica]